MNPDATRKQRALLLTVLLVAAAMLVALSSFGADPFKDDAYICLRYGQNLIEGNGLVFNPGERVEGFTTPLWTMLSAAILAVGLPAVGTLKTLGALCFLGLLWSAARALEEAGLTGGRAGGDGPETGAIDLPAGAPAPETRNGAAAEGSAGLWVGSWVGLALATSSALAYWALSGLETVAYAWALLEGTRRYAAAARAGRSGSAGGGLALGIATLLRPEGAAAFAVLAGLTAVYRWDASPREAARSFAPVIRSLVLFGLLVGGWELFRLSYYGAWLPNTFYAKVEREGYVVGRGLRYLEHTASSTGWLALLVPVLASPRSWRKPHVGLPGALSLFHLTYVVLVGGDYLAFGRFIIPILPLLALAWGGALVDWKRRLELAGAAPGLKRGLAMVALGTVLLTGLEPFFTHPGARDIDEPLERFRVASHWLAANTPKTAVVATPAIGAIGYLGQRRLLDTLGLIDPYLARFRNPSLDVTAEAGHARGDGAYVLSKSPDLILLANVWVRPVPLTPRNVAANQNQLTLTDRLLFGMPAFLQRYEVVNYRLEDGRYFGMAIRRDSPCHPDRPGYAGPATVR